MSEISVGYKVEALDGHAGTVGELVTDPECGEVTHFALEGGRWWGKKEVTLPVSAVERVAGERSCRVEIFGYASRDVATARAA